MDHLAARGIPCPTPVKGRDGRALRSLAGRSAAIVTFLRGMWPRRPTATHCQAVGEALARIHLAGIRLPHAPRQRPFGRRLAVALRNHGAAGPDAARPRSRGRTHGELATLERRWPQHSPWGSSMPTFSRQRLLRGRTAVRPDRLLLRLHRLPGLRLAVCLNAWCFEQDGSFNVTKARQLVSGYDAVRALTGEEREALPMLARGAAMRFLLTRLYDWLNTPRRVGHAQESRSNTCRICASTAVLAARALMAWMPSMPADDAPAPQPSTVEPATSSRCSPMAPVWAIPGPAAGAWCCAGAARKRSSRAASR